jgi:ABC-2 type transport system ATP-binding protein
MAETADQNTVIKVDGLVKSFGEHIVLDGIDLDVKSGEIFGVIGMSGSGKTTLLNSIVGFLRPDEGDICFRTDHLLQLSDKETNFRSVFHNTMDVKKIIGFAAQAPSFYSDLTVYENLDYFGTLHNLSKETRRSNIRALLKFLDLESAKKTLASNLSGGMQKRLDIGCALIHDPKVLIMDEPTADLDPILREQMWDIISEINNKGTTIIIASHFLDELEILCDRVGLLFEGRICNIDTPGNIKRRFAKDTEIILLSEPGYYKRILERMDVSKIKRQVEQHGRLFLYTEKAHEVLSDLLSALKQSEETLRDIKVNEPSLKEAFNFLVKRGN